MDSIPGSGGSPGGEHGNLLQYSGLENPMDRGAWRATVHWVTKNGTRLKRLNTDTHLRAQAPEPNELDSNPNELDSNPSCWTY